MYPKLLIASLTQEIVSNPGLNSFEYVMNHRISVKTSDYKVKFATFITGIHPLLRAFCQFG